MNLDVADEKNIPDSEPERQYYFMDLAHTLVEEESKRLGRKLTSCVKTFGCQMNARDSEKLAGILSYAGFVPTEDEHADFVIYNTCTVRENANNKVYGRLGGLGNEKKKNPQKMIALCGCMMQESQVIERIKESYGFINLIFGTHNIYKFPELLCESLQKRDELIIDVWDEGRDIVEDLPAKRKFSFKSGVNIMFGCDNFCSYCIVPYVRGRERSRRPKDILREIEGLASDGVREVMLLGQNVNSYGKKLDEDVTFAELLREVNNIDGIKRIRFMTSHPKDLSDELIFAMRDCDKVCAHMHLPLQSGSSRILKEMNRHYDAAQYLNAVDRLRSAIPDIAISTDIIVGFPGETEEDFLETLNVVKQVKFDSAFTFIYSKRNGTPAAKIEDHATEEEIKDRFNRLLSLVQQIGERKAKALEGKVMEVLVEERNAQDASLLTGRLENNAVVHFPGDASLIGELLNVRLDECKGFYYLGSLVG
ncbi:MAG: tRNA (N6-isopentenyl adenosine(37)-C2)-methylthiotransferase MiaB [Clostridiales bacterium]|nr:tRNA (N6-isopentenyl adenosine(37)-C2)-methylthiotransferase MiaB [Clostridiales bacterium]